MDPNYSIKSYEYLGIPLKETSYSSDIIEYINDIIYYGYDYPGHQTERYYIATQALIWEQTSPYKIEFYTERYGYGEYIDVSKEKSTEILLEWGWISIKSRLFTQKSRIGGLICIRFLQLGRIRSLAAIHRRNQ